MERNLEMNLEGRNNFRLLSQENWENGVFCKKQETDYFYKGRRTGKL